MKKIVIGYAVISIIGVILILILLASIKIAKIETLSSEKLKEAHTACQIKTIYYLGGNPMSKSPSEDSILESAVCLPGNKVFKITTKDESILSDFSTPKNCEQVPNLVVTFSKIAFYRYLIFAPSCHTFQGIIYN